MLKTILKFSVSSIVNLILGFLSALILTRAFAEKTADGLCKFFVDMWGLKVKQDFNPSDVLAEIESIRNNIKTLEARLAELEALVIGR